LANAESNHAYVAGGTALRDGAIIFGDLIGKLYV